ncbi:MAG: helix-turn-helix transcriptional regulator [Flammeovirgaceae bacterium]|nr:helix-turn-helix transcriptional regulator [Flammeovirgaceae bacterium]
MKTFGENLRELREAKGLLLREVGDTLKMDTALVSKFERDERKPTKDQVLAFAKFYNTSAENLLVAWLSEKIAYELVDEKVALKAVQLAEQKIRGYKHKH